MARRQSAYTCRGNSMGWIVFAVIALVALIIGAGIYLFRHTDMSAPLVTHTPVTPQHTTTQTPLLGASETQQPTETYTAVPVVDAAPNRPDAEPQRALDVLNTLEVRIRDSWNGYQRDQFGQRWQVLDGDGCDARQTVLARDLTDTSRRGCNVMRGWFSDPYTGASWQFERGWDTSGLVEIDHVVALADAWQKGAQRLSLPERVAFANDPLNLLAVSRDANQLKQGLDAANWLPENTERQCEYVARQIAVKAKWGLWLSAAEQQAMHDVLSTCPDQVTPTGATPG